MNPIGAIAVAISIVAFALICRCLRPRARKVRVALFGAFTLLSIPSLSSAVYYLHVLPEWAWFYTLRSWSGTEFLAIFLGCAAGAAATLLPRLLLGVPLFVLMAVAVVPYIKPLIWPIPVDQLQERLSGDTCIQSTGSTCGPASVCTILKHLGGDPSERAAARAAYSYVGGTEAWYLARYVRSEGFVPRFDFRETFSPSVGLPAMVGVRVGGLGHFIAVLAVTGDMVTFADPMRGEEHLPLHQFQHRYEFTGFHMVITKR
jgi:predicted double-glycine peptidase